jgi:hypothetical protein
MRKQPGLFPEISSLFGKNTPEFARAMPSNK